MIKPSPPNPPQTAPQGCSLLVRKLLAGAAGVSAFALPGYGWLEFALGAAPEEVLYTRGLSLLASPLVGFLQAEARARVRGQLNNPSGIGSYATDSIYNGCFMFSCNSIMYAMFGFENTLETAFAATTVAMLAGSWVGAAHDATRHYLAVEVNEKMDHALFGTTNGLLHMSVRGIAIVTAAVCIYSLYAGGMGPTVNFPWKS